MRTMNRAMALGIGAAALVVGAQILRTLRSRSRRYALDGRVVMITGGSRGLGLVLAREFARHGARLVLTARDTDELARARAELRSHGADVLAVRCDATDEADVRDAVTVALDWYGAIDVLVNNAGTIEVGPVATMTTADHADALPLVSMSAERAARRIVLACRRRESHVILSAPAKVAALLHAVLPGLTSSLLAGVNRLLPASESGPAEPSRGADVETAVSPSVLTTLSDQASARNNEMRARA